MQERVNRSVAIIVTYYPQEQLERNVNALLEQCEHVVLVDNTDTNDIPVLLERLKRHKRVLLIRLGSNFGIARALNEGLRWSKLLGCDWVFTFDQDSFPPKNFCAKLHKAFIEVMSQGHLMLLASPVYMHPEIKIVHSFGSSAGQNQFIDFTMTSGNLLELSKIDKVGGFREDYFIDYVDVEFNLRARTLGYSILEVADAVLEHRLGDSTRERFINKDNVVVTHHNPLRRYYNARNRVRSYLDLGRAQPAWLKHDLYTFIKEVIKIMVYEKNAARKLRAVSIGIVDGLMGRLGKARIKF